MLRFKDNQVTGSKFQEWSFSIVHNNSEQSFDSLKHFSHKTKLLLPKFCPPAVLLRQKNPNFSFLAFVKNLLDAKSSNTQNWKLCWAHQKIRRNTTMGGIWDLGVAANSGTKKLPTSILPHWLAAFLCAVMMQRKMSFRLDCQQQILTIIPLFLFDVII